jgi:F-type H+-transporting ATPase subunit b
MLDQLGNILLKALPTFVLVVFLYVYLRRMFFRPLDEVLEKRREAGEGARRRAEELLRSAEQKNAQNEAALEAVRIEMHREREAERQKTVERNAARVKQARAQADAQVRQAREGIAAEVAAAKRTIESQSSLLAEQIIRQVLGKGAA